MKVKKLMTPVDDYQTFGLDATLGDVAAALTGSKHRDILVLDETGALAGVVTMTDIIMALEPNYKNLNKNDLDSDILSNRFVADQFKKFNLWTDTLINLCNKGIGTKVSDAMHILDDNQYVEIDADLEHGVHLYIIGTPQPLVVRDNGKVVGILRMADVFDELITRMNTCAS